MRHLKKLTCNKITDELRQAHGEILLYRHMYVNSTFDFAEELPKDFYGTAVGEL
jgi:hypothetical protein